MPIRQCLSCSDQQKDLKRSKQEDHCTEKLPSPITRRRAIRLQRPPLFEEALLGSCVQLSKSCRMLALGISAMVPRKPHQGGARSHREPRLNQIHCEE